MTDWFQSEPNTRVESFCFVDCCLWSSFLVTLGASRHGRRFLIFAFSCTHRPVFLTVLVLLIMTVSNELH
jgi:hypothetical protein